LNRDDGDDEILDIINQHQNDIGSLTKEFRKISEEDKGEDADKDVYNHLFNHAFKNKGSQFDKTQAGKLNSLSLKSQPYSDPVSANPMWQQGKQQAQMPNMAPNGQVYKQGSQVIHQKPKMHTHIGGGNNNTISLNIPTNNIRSNTRHSSAQIPYPPQLSHFGQANINQKIQQQQQPNKQAEIMARINYLCSDRRTNQPFLFKTNQFSQSEAPGQHEDYINSAPNFEDENSEGIESFLQHSNKVGSLDLNGVNNNIGSFVQENHNGHEFNNMNMLNTSNPNSNQNQINNEILATFAKGKIKIVIACFNLLIS